MIAGTTGGYEGKLLGGRQPNGSDFAEEGQVDYEVMPRFVFAQAVQALRVQGRRQGEDLQGFPGQGDVLLVRVGPVLQSRFTI